MLSQKSLLFSKEHKQLLLLCFPGRSNRKMTEEMEMRFSSPLWGQCTQYAGAVVVAVSAEIVKKKKR